MSGLGCSAFIKSVKDNEDSMLYVTGREWLFNMDIELGLECQRGQFTTALRKHGHTCNYTQKKYLQVSLDVTGNTYALVIPGYLEHLDKPRLTVT